MVSEKLRNRLIPAFHSAILQPMQCSVAESPHHPSPSFAGLLAAFARPEEKFPPTPDEAGIADDIVTLSYEHALRNHARYRPAEVDGGESEHGDPIALPAPHVAALKVESSIAQTLRVPAATPSRAASMDKNFKRASITIRLSQSDCAQLHQRAAESGLTLSAYLRSCTLEVETLRAQVKETLAQLRPTTSGQVANQGSRKPAAKACSVWSRLWTKIASPAKTRVVPA